MCLSGTHQSHHVSGFSDTDTGISRIVQEFDRISTDVALRTQKGSHRDWRLRLPSSILFTGGFTGGLALGLLIRSLKGSSHGVTKITS